MTPATRRALEIVRDNPGIEPAQFCRLMWPDSDGHKHHTNCGPKGVCLGGGMRLAAGGYLAKLAKRGLVRRSLSSRSSGYYLTKDALEVLK